MNQPTNENLKLALDLMAKTTLDVKWREGLRYDALKQWASQVGQVCEHALKRIEDLETAVKPFSEFAENNTDDHGWAGIRCERERIVDWFGPSDFRKAREVMKNETLPGRP